MTAVPSLLPEFAAAVPDWKQTLTVPLWRPDPPRDAALNSAIVAHISALGDLRSPAPGTNAIVHFADDNLAEPLDTLFSGLELCSHQEGVRVVVILVLPCGSFQRPRSALERRLGAQGSRWAGSVAVTEDYARGWSRTFAVTKTPSTCLINAWGQPVWQHTGRLDPRSFGAALEEHLLEGIPQQPRPLRLAVGPGGRAPDVLFKFARGGQMALRRLRGQRVLLNFWQSWSAPCLSELGRLQRVHSQSGRRRPIILAVNDGEELTHIAEVQREHRLEIALIPDPKREISQRYGVDCWPVTVAIDENGIVDGVQFGLAGTAVAGHSLAGANP